MNTRQTSKYSTPSKCLLKASNSEIQHDIALITGEFALPRKQENPPPVLLNRPKRATHRLRTALDLTAAVLGIASFINEKASLVAAVEQPRKRRRVEDALPYERSDQAAVACGGLAVSCGVQLFQGKPTAFHPFKVREIQRAHLTGNCSKQFALAYLTSALKKAAYIT